jgi:hypothetical protein
MTAKPEDDPDEAAELAQRLPLLDALIRWVDPKLTEGIRQCEQRHTMRELLTYGAPVLSDPSLLIVLTSTSWMAGPSDFGALAGAWRAAVRDFKRQIQDGELHLEGVEFTDDLSARPQAIPGTFAAKIILDFSGSALKVGRREFLSVKVFRSSSNSADTSSQNIESGPVQEASSPRKMGGKGRLGRPRFPLEAFVQIARDGARIGNNKADATDLLNRFCELYPGTKPPAYRTVLDHVENIYDELHRARAR